ncbi:MAG TPA: hypothetical protein VKZ18_13200 [Polyangia bacterium]|nr:hypothetical protein [Polyangia bacterium]
MSGRKTLLPELLPTPRSPGAETPRARVAARARAMLERLSGLKTAAGAAVLAVHCGYGVVDPVPPPPAHCTANGDPFTGITAENIVVTVDGSIPDATIKLWNYGVVGYQVGGVRVTAGGTLVRVDDLSSTGSGGGTDIVITIVPDGSGTPIDFEVDLSCGGATSTEHYRATATGGGDYTVVDLG